MRLPLLGWMTWGKRFRGVGGSNWCEFGDQRCWVVSCSLSLLIDFLVQLSILNANWTSLKHGTILPLTTISRRPINNQAVKGIRTSIPPL